MVKLVAEEYSNFYYAPCCSKASITCILMMCLTFLAPFYLSFTTENFWLTLKVGYEFPNTQMVQLKLVQTDATQYIDNLNIYPIWKDLKVGTINFERIDEYSVEFTVKNFKEKNMELVLELNYMLTDMSTLNSRSLIFLSFSSGYYFDSVKFYGDLRLLQQYPVSYNGYNNKQNTKPLYDDSILYQDYMRANIFYNNQTAYLDYEYFTQMSTANGLTQTRDVTVVGKIHVPRYESILYIPSIAETLKFAWTAYFSICVVLLYLFRFLLKQMYRNAVFPVSVTDNLPLKVYKQKHD